MHEAVADRFWMKVKRSSVDDCWDWQASKDRDGYGSFQMQRPRRRAYRAHRISWEMANGEQVPDEMMVCHSCDNPSCVNPAHLLLGSAQSNAQDREERARSFHHRDPEGAARLARDNLRKVGADHTQAKLTDRDVIEIRWRVANGEKQRTIAADFGVSPSTITEIKQRKKWKHLG